MSITGTIGRVARTGDRILDEALAQAEDTDALIVSRALLLRANLEEQVAGAAGAAKFDERVLGRPGLEPGEVRHVKARLGNARAQAGSDADAYAKAFEVEYADRGAAAARVNAGTGLRPCELLGLRVEDVDFARGVLRVERELARTEDWPAVAPPKDFEVREVHFWEHVRPDLELLVELAVDGWLLPPTTTGQRKWLSSWDRLSRLAREACGWPAEFTQYSLRHHFATYSLASVEDGGYAFSLATVSAWLGHASTHHTNETYNHPGLHRPEDVATRTGHRPGRAGPQAGR
mgnify:CR=1 FL=1